MRDGGWSRRRFTAALARTAAAALPAATACGDAPRPGSAATPAASSAGGGAPGREHAPPGPRPLHLGTFTSAEGGGRGIGEPFSSPVAVCALPL
ncbi:hypothetical protein [Streptomyces sp. NPDC127100]|uniref:hypothetical protein n=1 Tax=Streptomyces sp. NPDC127100 TaxID=3347138 RepID=UPI00364BC281